MERLGSQFDATPATNSSGSRRVARATGGLPPSGVCVLISLNRPSAGACQGVLPATGVIHININGGVNGGVNGGEVTLGRGEDCDIRLVGETISRHHCRILRRAGGYVVVDLSRNGTSVNGRRIRECELRDGDEIKIGHQVMQVRLGASRATGTLIPRATLSPHPLAAGPVIYHSSASDKAGEVAAVAAFIVKGIEDGVTQQFVDRRLSIGRRPGNHILLEGDRVSREHAALIADEAGCWLLDLESVNGTFVNGQRVERARLASGDLVRIGNYDCQINFRDGDCLLNFRLRGPR